MNSISQFLCWQAPFVILLLSRLSFPLTHCWLKLWPLAQAFQAQTSWSQTHCLFVFAQTIDIYVDFSGHSTHTYTAYNQIIPGYIYYSPSTADPEVSTLPLTAHTYAHFLNVLMTWLKLSGSGYNQRSNRNLPMSAHMPEHVPFFLHLIGPLSTGSCIILTWFHPHPQNSAMLISKVFIFIFFKFLLENSPFFAFCCLKQCSAPTVLQTSALTTDAQLGHWLPWSVTLTYKCHAHMVVFVKSLFNINVI